jgi:hypothetical protein
VKRSASVAEGWDALGEVLAHVLLDRARGVGASISPVVRLGQQLVQGDAVDQVQRVQRVALGLGHLLAFGVARPGA